MSDWPPTAFTSQTWVVICLGVGSAAFYAGALTSTGEKYVTRTEYQAAINTVHESVAELKATVSAMDLYVRQNLPERKAR